MTNYMHKVRKTFDLLGAVSTCGSASRKKFSNYTERLNLKASLIRRSEGGPLVREFSC